MPVKIQYPEAYRFHELSKGLQYSILHREREFLLEHAPWEITLPGSKIPFPESWTDEHGDTGLGFVMKDRAAMFAQDLDIHPDEPKITANYIGFMHTFVEQKGRKVPFSEWHLCKLLGATDERLHKYVVLLCAEEGPMLLTGIEAYLDLEENPMPKEEAESVSLIMKARFKEWMDHIYDLMFLSVNALLVEDHGDVSPLLRQWVEQTLEGELFLVKRGGSVEGVQRLHPGWEEVKDGNHASKG